MKFTKLGKALLMSAVSGVVFLGVTSCVQSYTVGYLYVTGTVTSSNSGNGIISGFDIDHNTGKLNTIDGLPISSGGANPVRAVLTVGSKFIYVLNRGTTSSGGSDCTTADPCQNSNIQEFAVGGNGILTPQETFYRRREYQSLPADRRQQREAFFMSSITTRPAALHALWRLGRRHHSLRRYHRIYHQSDHGAAFAHCECAGDSRPTARPFPTFLSRPIRLTSMSARDTC